MNPNGLTDEQIAARPKPFVGMLLHWRNSQWVVLEQGTIGLITNEWSFHRLPGEPDCPWPPPERFQREWKEGDRAWVLCESVWYLSPVKGEHFVLSDTLRSASPVVWDTYFETYISTNSPAIYIPNNEVRA